MSRSGSTASSSAKRADRELTLDIRGDGVIRASDERDAEQGEVALRSPHRELLALFDDWIRDRRLEQRREFEIYGELLWQTLFPADVSRLLDQARERAAEAGMPLRVQLFFDETAAELGRLPWEYLFRRSPPTGASYFLATRPDILLSRYLPLDTGRGEIAPDAPPLRILIALSKPSDLGPVATQQPVAAIEALEADGVTTVDIEPAATVEALLSAMERVRPHVLHVMGHGAYDIAAGEARIALVDDAGRARWLDDVTFADLIAQTGAPPALVVLHLCEGGTADYREDFAGLGPQIVRRGAQAVVAMQHRISNGAASAFSTRFYGEIAAHARVDEAVRRARLDLVVGRFAPRDFGTPVLFMRSRSGALGAVQEAST